MSWVNYIPGSTLEMLMSRWPEDSTWNKISPLLASQSQYVQLNYQSNNYNTNTIITLTSVQNEKLDVQVAVYKVQLSFRREGGRA